MGSTIEVFCFGGWILGRGYWHSFLFFSTLGIRVSGLAVDLPILVIDRFERKSRRLGTFLSFFGSRAHLTSLWLVERKGGELGASRTSSIILSTAKHLAPGVKKKKYSSMW